MKRIILVLMSFVALYATAATDRTETFTPLFDHGYESSATYFTTPTTYRCQKASWTVYLGSIKNNLDSKPLGTNDYAILVRARKDKETTNGYILSSVIAGGIKNLSFRYASNGDNSEIPIKIYINDDEKYSGNLTVSSTSAKSFTLSNINVEGNFKIKIENCGDVQSQNKLRLVIDNLTWTPYTDDIRTYMVTPQRDPSGDGWDTQCTFSPSTLTVQYGSPISVNGNQLTAGGQTITASTVSTTRYTYTFTGWTTSPTHVYENTKVTANFSRTKNSYPINAVVNPSGYGSVSPSSITVPYESTITTNGNQLSADGKTITATPAANTAQYTYSFSGWTNVPSVSGNNTTVTANFTRTTNIYTVTINTNGAYGTVNKTIVSGVPYGTQITTSGNTINVNGTTVTATPATTTAQYSYSFTGWTNGTATVTGNTTVTANFSRVTNNYTVTISASPSGYGSVDKATVANVPYGTVLSTSGNKVTINGTTVTATPTTATAQYTYAFNNWTDVPASVTGNLTVKANFTRTTNQYTITFKNEDGATLQTGLVEYGQTPVYSGETPTKASTAQYTYTFDTWSPAITAVTQAQDYTATYTSTLRTYTVTIEATPAGYGSVDVSSVANVPYGTVITSSDNTIDVNGTTVTATPATATSQFIYSFDSWTNGTATVEGDLTVTAKFSREANILQISEMATTADWTEGETRDVQLTRTFVSSGYNTICLPFAVTNGEMTTKFGENVKLYSLSNVTTGSTITINFSEVDPVAISAGTPYLLEVENDVVNPTFDSREMGATTPGSANSDNVTFYGVYVQTLLDPSATPTQYFLSGSLLYRPVTADYMKGLRGYFTVAAPAGTPIRVAINQPTNIVSPSLSGEGRGEATKIIKDNQLLIIRDGKIYNALGEIKK